jgi:hypothetical protein
MTCIKKTCQRKPEDLESVAILELQLVSAIMLAKFGSVQVRAFCSNLEREPGVGFKKLLNPKPEPAIRFSSAFERVRTKTLERHIGKIPPVFILTVLCSE